MEKQYADPLRFVTPHMRGPKVVDAQWLMAGHNRFKGLATMKDAQIDGDYGLISAQATKRTKFWVGYPLESCDMVFGQTLYEYLRPNNWRPLPEAYRLRRAARIRAATRTPGMKALAYAVTQLGTHEYPAGSNKQKYGVWYGWNGVPWCAIFDSYCFAHSGYTAFRYASVELIVMDARAGRNHLRIVHSPQPGDLACYTSHGDPYAHVAFFEKWLIAGQTFQDLGGNTGPASLSNGGAVMRGQRNLSQVTAFVRVGG